MVFLVDFDCIRFGEKMMSPVDNNLQALSVLDQAAVKTLRKANDIVLETGTQLIDATRQQSEAIQAHADRRAHNPAHLGQNVDEFA